MTTVRDVNAFLARFAPLSLAAEWDNVGLLLGSDAGTVQRLMTCLTLTPRVAAEAIDRRCDLIVTHHPILFRAVKRLTDQTPEGAMLLSLVQAGVAVYCPHTAFDNCTGGINDILAAKLSLTEVRPLREKETPQYKVVVFVPAADLPGVSAAMFREGAGIIGEYRECSFRVLGTGTFHGAEATHPTVGQKGVREEVSEWRLEVVCPGERLEAVLQALRKAHSYEEPAIDVCPLAATGSRGGEGRVGNLEEGSTLAQLGERLKQALDLSAIHLVGDPTMAVHRLVIACGSGGEMRFHDCLAAEARGLGVLVVGHHASERIGVEALATRLQQEFPQLHVWASQSERDPLRTM